WSGVRVDAEGPELRFQPLAGLSLLIAFTFCLLGALVSGGNEPALLVTPAQPAPRSVLVNPCPEEQTQADVREPARRDRSIRAALQLECAQVAAVQPVLGVTDDVVGNAGPCVLDHFQAVFTAPAVGDELNDHVGRLPHQPGEIRPVLLAG